VDGGHIDDGPVAASGGGGEDLAGAAAQDRVAVLSVFPLSVGVACTAGQFDQLQQARQSLLPNRDNQVPCP
jgi:hypothetical protein